MSASATQGGHNEATHRDHPSNKVPMLFYFRLAQGLPKHDTDVKQLS